MEVNAGHSPAEQLQQYRCQIAYFCLVQSELGRSWFLVCRQVPTQTVWRGLACLCIVPRSSGLAGLVHRYLLAALESFVCFPYTTGWNLFRYFVFGVQGTEFPCSLPSWCSLLQFATKCKRGEKIALNTSVEELLKGQIWRDGFRSCAAALFSFSTW